jgi:hypothetical protein
VANSAGDLPFFPRDISRSGYFHWNLRVLVEFPDQRGSHLELIFVDCDQFSGWHFRDFFLRGRVDSLKRVELQDLDRENVLRCSRLLYRFLDIDQVKAREHYGLGLD